MSGWFATLGVVAQIAFRNLFASRLKTIIVGGIIFFGGLLVVTGNSLLDSLVASMSRSVIGSVAGHIQVYNAKSKDSLEVMGRMMMGDPDLAQLDDFAKVRASLAEGPERQVGRPDGDQRRAGHLGQHDRSRAREAAQRGQGPARRQDRRRAGRKREAQIAAEKEHVRQIVSVLQGDLKNAKAVLDEKAIDPDDAAGGHARGLRPVLAGLRQGSVRGRSSSSRTGSPARRPTPTCCSSTTSAPTSRRSRSRSTA